MNQIFRPFFCLANVFKTMKGSRDDFSQVVPQLLPSDLLGSHTLKDSSNSGVYLVMNSGKTLGRHSGKTFWVDRQIL